MSETLHKTPLHDWHVAHGGRMVDFAGWAMPVQYRSIVEEHNAVRTDVGMFDVSHMGRLQIHGGGAAGFLDSVLTRRVTDMRPGEIRYSLVCDAAGGILDDVLVYRLVSDSEAKRDDQAAFQLVVNAGNREKIETHFKSYADGAIQISDLTKATGMIAVQGPRAIEVVAGMLDGDLPSLANYHGVYSEVANYACYVSRTGYTGEDGVELIVSNNYAPFIWEMFERDGVRACGLAARDTLRLEAAMPLYGHELSESINPVQAGLGFAVNVKDRDFVGRDAIMRLTGDKDLPVRVGLEIDGKRPAREGASVLHDGEVVGSVTSGTASPTLGKPIAMAYVKPDVAKIGTDLVVDIRGNQAAASVVKLPFYKRN